LGTIPILIFVVIVLVAGGVLLWALLQDAFINIKPGEIGIVITRGKPADRGLPPGVHFALRFGRVIEIYPSVEIAYLTLRERDAMRTAEDSLTFVDPPLRVSLGDRTLADVFYTVRFRLTSEGLPSVQTRFGRTGLKSAVRDESRRAVIAALGDPSVTAADALGARRAQLEEKVKDALTNAMASCGFTLALFNLRELDLAQTGEVIQAALRATEELERERALGAVRKLRAEQEAEINAALTGGMTRSTLEYLRVQATRELIARWDGKLLTPPGSVGLVPPDSAADGGPEQQPAEPTPPPAQAAP